MATLTIDRITGVFSRSFDALQVVDHRRTSVWKRYQSLNFADRLYRKDNAVSFTSWHRAFGYSNVAVLASSVPARPAPADAVEHRQRAEKDAD